MTGRLRAPSFLLSAAAPIAYALVIERFGAAGALYLSLSLGVVALAAAAGLPAMFPAARRAVTSS